MMSRFIIFKRFNYAFITVILLIAIGVIGYMWIEDWNFLESLYMTIITMATVGFSEVKPLSSEGRLFTMGLIISSISVFTYAVALITSYIAEGNFKRFLDTYNLRKQLEKMENHVIICGFGRVGKGAAEDLSQNGIPYVLIDQNIEFNEELHEKELIFIHGDASHEEILRKAGVDRASALISCLPSDADNLYVVLSARQLNPELCIISRATRHDAVSKLKIAGATNVIMPDTVGGNHMAALVTNPDLMEFLDVIRYEGNQGINVKSLMADELPVLFLNRCLGSISRTEVANCKIIGLKSAEGNYIVNPSDEFVIVSGTRLFLLGNQSQILALEAILS
jgi:voltage-gated potassium channel